LVGARIAGVHARQGDEATFIVRPALQNRKLVKIEIFAHDDFFARRVFGSHGFGERAVKGTELRQHLELVEDALGRLDIHKAGDALGNLVESFDTKRKSHAAFAAELINQNLVSRITLDV